MGVGTMHATLTNMLCFVFFLKVNQLFHKLSSYYLLVLCTVTALSLCFDSTCMGGFDEWMPFEKFVTTFYVNMVSTRVYIWTLVSILNPKINSEPLSQASVKVVSEERSYMLVFQQQLMRVLSSLLNRVWVEKFVLAVLTNCKKQTTCLQDEKHYWSEKF